MGSRTDSAKGNSYVKRVKAFRERNGFLVHKAEKAARLVVLPRRIPGSFPMGNGKWGKYVTNANDIWGIGDLISLSRTLMVQLDQVTTIKHRADHRRKIQDVLRPLLPGPEPHLGIEITLWSWGRWKPRDRSKPRGWGFVVENYLGGTEWGPDFFVPSADVPRP